MSIVTGYCRLGVARCIGRGPLEYSRSAGCAGSLLHRSSATRHSRQTAQQCRSGAATATYSAEAAETMVQLCSIDDWSIGGKLPPGAAAACSLVLPRKQQSSSNLEHLQDSRSTDRSSADTVLQQLLVAVLGNLDATLAHPQLSTLLYQVPPSSLKLLLSSHDLTVTSEDTVWFTVQQYLDAHLAHKAATHQRQLWDLEPAYVAALYEDLYSLVRLPNVTDYCLDSVASVLDQVANASGREDFAQLSGHIAKLSELRRLDGFVPEYRVQRMVDEGAPDSWLMGPRTGALVA